MGQGADTRQVPTKKVMCWYASIVGRQYKAETSG